MNQRGQSREQYEDDILAFLMDGMLEEEGWALLEENERLNEDPDAAVPADLDEKCRALLRSFFPNEQVKKAGRVTLKVLKRVLVAAVVAAALFATAYAAVIIYGDLWFQKPSNDPVESVRSALENQAGKDYTIKIEIKSVEIDEMETERVVERFIKGVIADWRGWSDEYLAEHFLVVKAVYYAEYDHTQTTRSDGEVTMYFYLTQDVDSGTWTIVDNSGNVNWLGNDSANESSDPVVKSTKEQIFFYLSKLFNEAYSPYYDGLHYL